MTDTATPPGTYALGPETGTLTVHTTRTGAASRAGHDLELEVGAWSATVALPADPSDTRLALTADARSLRVRNATGGMSALGDDDRQGIAQTIDEDVLKGTAIAFASTRVTAAGSGLSVAGELELSGTTQPITFELTLADGRLAARAVITQSTWGIKPYSALFGTLKVADDVTVAIDARLSDPA